MYAAISLYYQRFQVMNEQTGGKFSSEDELFIWQQVLRENIFVIAKTPMAKHITQRTLAGYQDMETNIEYIEDIVNKSKASVSQAAKEVRSKFNDMKFDVVIGNPPYQEESKGGNDNYRAPIYNEFMDLSNKLANVVTLITPARFLFDAGSTPKDWNKKILNDKHLKIIKFEADSSKIFPRTDIKGGVVITLRDTQKNFESVNEIYSPAGIYIPFEELNGIMKKVLKNTSGDLSSIIYSPENYKFTDLLHLENPKAESKLSKGHKYDLKSNVFDKLPDIFLEQAPNSKDNYVKIYGLSKKKRTYRFIKEEYIANKNNFKNWKVFVPKANGSGALGETLSTPLIGKPLIGNTQTFISIGNFKTEFEAEAAMKYIKTKFARVMLGILKITQDNTSSRWRLVPLQDFTPNSDIDWTKSVSEIDQQLYKKYDLTADEIEFIETKVQAME